MRVFRPIDRWFVDKVLPHEGRFLERAVRLTRTRDEARELVQEAFVRLFDFAGWATISDPRHYVLRMLRNIAIERARRASIVDFRQISDFDAIQFVDESPDALRVAAARDQVRRMLAVLEKMPADYRAILLQRRLDDRVPSEIARESGISLSTLEKRLARAIHLLNRGMEAYADPAEKASVKSGAGNKAAG